MSDLLLRDYRPVTLLRGNRSESTYTKRNVIDVHTHFGPLVLGSGYACMYDTAKVIDELRSLGVEKVCNVELVWDSALQDLEDKLEGYSDTIFTLPSVDLSTMEQPEFEKNVAATLARYKSRGYKGIKLWKDITLFRRSSDGRQFQVDDSRLACVFDLAAENGLFVLIHIGDPKAFFEPFNQHNEYFDCLVDSPEWRLAETQSFSFEDHLRMQENVLSRHPQTTFVIAHVGSCAEDLSVVSQHLDMFDNMHIDIAARISELGRQPYTARRFFEKYQDRILFGTDFIADQSPLDIYPYYFRFLETFDEYFPYAPPGDEYSLGRWRIYGLGLPESILEKVYNGNAKRLLKLT